MLLDQAPVVGFEVDVEGQVLAAFGGGLRPLGIHPAHHLGRTIFDLYRDAFWVVKSVARALGGETFTAVGEVRGAWYEAWYAPVREPGGAITGAVGFAVEITARVRAEVARREGEDRLHALSDAAFEGVVVCERGRVRLANEALARLLGVGLPELLGRELADLFPTSCRETVTRVVSAPDERPVEIQGERAWGEPFLVELRGRRVLYGGRAVAVISLRDVTDRRQAERNLRQERDFNRVILDTLDALVIVLDPFGRIVRFNPACEKVTGYAEVEVVGRKVWEFLLVPEEVDEVREIFSELAEGRRTSQHANAWVARDGSRRWIAWNNSAVVGEDGVVAYVIGTGIDVTERRKAEQELERARDQLLQAQKMEAVGRLAGGIAHDFNNVLTVVLMSGETVAMRLPAGDPAGDAARRIVDAARRASGLTRQLLAFTRPHAARAEVVDLAARVRDAGQMLRPLLGEDIDLRLHTPGEPCLVRVDAAQIEQVLVNLVVNARDALPRGGRVDVEVGPILVDEPAAGLPPRRHVALVVRDEGIGMDAATRARVFEPFFTTKAPGKGTGLGLATVYAIVRQWRGEVTVESEPGRGTTFRVYLPGEPVGTLELAAGRADGPAPDGDETVLLVEDEPLVRDVVAAALEAHGYTVWAATDPVDALRVLSTGGGQVDVVVTDIVMPRGSGPELVARLPRAKGRPRVLFVSAYADHALLEEALLAPGTAFLQKPFQAGALARKMRELLDGPPR